MKKGEFNKLNRNDEVVLFSNQKLHFGLQDDGEKFIAVVATPMVRTNIAQFVYDGKFAFINRNGVDHKHTGTTCPKCEVGLSVVDGDNVVFKSSHSHYARKCSYTRKDYVKDSGLNGTSRIIAALNLAAGYVPITAPEIAHIAKMEVKTVRNILGVLIREGIVIKTNHMLTCFVSGKVLSTYRIPTMYEDFKKGKFNINRFGKRCAELNKLP